MKSNCAENFPMSIKVNRLWAQAPAAIAGKDSSKVCHDNGICMRAPFLSTPSAGPHLSEHTLRLSYLKQNEKNGFRPWDADIIVDRTEKHQYNRVIH